ncbi:transmembrane protein 170A isoform X2 [Podarcis raffonei]|uniref:transmembrane protein 170A isoform X2 n=1 Tax=Podarcis raffonei TaxID=65483 RepID=UPI00232909A0|nr:transmembrane protein 170A isoform X2 [Podarcis raffonei]
MEGGGGGGGDDSVPPAPGGLLHQILSLHLVPRSGNVTRAACAESLCEFTALLALFTLRRHRYGRFMSVSILLMGFVGPLAAGILSSAAIAGVYKAAGKDMIPFVAMTFGVGQTFGVVMISFLRILATL